MFEFHATNEDATARLGAALAEVLQPGTVVALDGPLGAGKTRLVQAVATALGVPVGTVTSPTFVLINEYSQGRLPVYHFDAYRLRDTDEFAELGPDEYFFGEGVCFVEWASRISEMMPADRLEIRIEIGDATVRQFRIYGSGERTARTVEQLAKRLASRKR
jgi:tRNA threonylcarbamoyladenosine biosynthesis protein TsaE